jgi:WD40 repeat protein
VKKLVVLTLVAGTISTGFRVHWEVSPDGERTVADGYTQLPPRPELELVYQLWDTTYRSLDGSHRITIKANQITNVKFTSLKWDCERQAGRLAKSINDWLNSTNLSRIIEEYLVTSSDDEYRVIIRTDDAQLRQLPWHLWTGWERLNYPEIALGAPHAKRRERTYQQQVRILIVLGNSEGIDIEIDRQILSRYCQGTDLHFIAQPSLAELRAQLLDKRGWDLLFFSGHSRTENDGSKGRIFLNHVDSLTVAELGAELHTAVSGGLQIAVFNSCDGLGIAAELASLHIPQVIVMRQPVPDLVAQAFLKYFLAEFTGGGSLYQSVSTARDRLRALEVDFPCASWLPIVIQNRLETPPTWQNLGAIDRCPYRGLAAFRAEDTTYFHGREQVVDTLVKAVHSRSLIPLLGASGSGKSSVVFAGLLPQLSNGLGRWQFLCLRPGKSPLAAMVAAMMTMLAQGSSLEKSQLLAAKLDRSIRQDKFGLINFIEQYGFAHQQHLLIVVDRFEELYTETVDEIEQQLFIDNLLIAIDGLPAVKLLFTLRADFYDRLLEDYSLATALEHTEVVNLTTMTRAELTRSIELPARSLNVSFEAGLTARIIDNIIDNAYSLPLLEFALTQLWAKQRDGKLTHRGYDDIGGVEQALANHGEAVYQQLTVTEQIQLRAILMQLVQLNSDTDTARIRLAVKSEIGAMNWDLVEHLVAVRLVAIDRHQLTGEETVEPIHEALIKYWDRLKLWIEIDSDFRRWQEYLRAAIGRWQNSNRDVGGLIRGQALTTALFWYEQYSIQISDSERDFIDLSRHRQQQDIIAKQRLHRAIVSGLTGGLAIISICAGVALWQWHQANMQRQLAVNSHIRSLTSTAELLFKSGTHLSSLQQAVSATNQLVPTANSNSEIRLPTLATLSEILDRIRAKQISSNHTDRVASVAYSRDGKLVVSAGWDNRINIWNDRGELLQTLSGESEQFLKILIHPNGNTLITASFNRSVKTWHKDLVTGKWLERGESILDTPATAIALSPNGDSLVIATKNSGLRLYTNLDLVPIATANRVRDELDAGYRYQPISIEPALVYDLSFSPDGQKFAVAAGDGTVKIWQADGQSSIVRKPDDVSVLTVSFSPDGKSIATGNRDGKIEIWHENGQLVRTFSKNRQAILHLNFSPDGRSIAVASEGRDLQIWNPFTGKEIETLVGHTDSINEVSFSPDGNLLVTGSADRQVGFWQIHRPLTADSVAAKLPPQIASFSYSPDGELLALGTPTGRLVLLDRHHRVIGNFVAHQQEVMDVSISADGKYLATTDGLFKNPQVKLWQRDGTLFKTLSGYKVIFSPTQPLFAVIGANGALNVYDLDGRAIATWQLQPAGSSARISALGFSPDGQTLMTGDRAIKIWSLTGKLLTTSPQLPGNIIDFSSSSQRHSIAIASDDGSVTLFSTQDRSLRTLGIQSGLSTVAFSQDGSVLLTGNRQGQLQFWSQTGQLLKTIFNSSTADRALSKVRFSPEDRSILAIDAETRAIYYDLDRSRLLRRAHHWQNK